ncbi:NACHT domain-containing protein [Streptomyces sp. NPDC008222]|uniref:NACHT domain-containing protein n=1 Tax=Streptomyces sp. NPDC008222 TaxID=3364820 RepID=UPI0036E9DFA2
MAADDNQRGDLFGRLVCDAFHSLGYEDFQLNTNRSGREIDIKGRHRAEQKFLVAECKATSRPIGGADLNKFAGASQVESRIASAPVSSYFVSLSGFTASAREQEIEAGPRMNLMDAGDVVAELIRGKVIVPRERAVSAAVSAIGCTSAEIQVDDQKILIAHGIGWVWCIRFKTHGEPTHYTLIHADGYGISDALVAEIQKTDRNSTDILSGLSYLSSVTTSGVTSVEDEARAEYLDFLIREFGSVTLEGLPVDQETGSRSLRFDALYVPQRFIPVASPLSGPEEEVSEEEVPKRISTYEVLKSNRHVAVLAGPGSGKTTLLKRLAIAYNEADNGSKFADPLPREELLPLFVRCRQLGDRCRHPIVKILGSLIEQAEVLDKTQAFTNVVSRSLKDGSALVLVDGLDEINDPRDRLAFTTQLRTFIATYPLVRVIFTSREAGFRSVAGAVAPVCSAYRISDLSDDDIRQLCVSWHREMLGDTSASRDAAGEAYAAIANNPRVAALAVNPLLLNTLLLVKRWMGEIPSKRTVLYSKAIEVLLMTWNTEGHESLDLEEALPQLAYAAFSMLKAEKQSVSARELRFLFSNARKDMPEILGYSRLSVDEFIRRVEERSSLIVQSGIVVENGMPRPLYEFKHLTFQEYLAALAAAESWHPGRDEEPDPSVVLEPHFENQAWLEVVPLAAVMSGIKHAKLIVRKLIDEIKSYEVAEFEDYPYRDDLTDATEHPLYLNLLNCVVDGSPIHPDLAREALQTLISYWGGRLDIAIHFRGNRLRPLLADIAWECYQGESSHYLRAGQILALLRFGEMSLDVDEIVKELLSTDDRAATTMALALTQYFPSVRLRRTRYRRSPSPGAHVALKAALLTFLLKDPAPDRRFAGTWAIAEALPFYRWTKAEVKAIIELITDLWRNEGEEGVCDIYWWAVSRLPVEGIRFGAEELPLPRDLEDFIELFFTVDMTSDWANAKRSAVKLAYFHRDHFSDERVLSEIWELEQTGLLDPEWFDELKRAVNQPPLFEL